jgi:glycosyltransferase involved in cell wall biosynthesis
MKIVLISSGALPVPPQGYGGLEQVVYDLAAELVKEHEVHVVAPTESKLPTGCNLIDGGPCVPNAAQWEFDVFQKYSGMFSSEEFKDAIWHDHTWRKFIYIAKANLPNLNVMSTLHGMLPYQSPPPVARPSLCGISMHHADSISAGLGIPTRFVYNGIDLQKYTYEPGQGRTDRYLFLARITPFKGTHTFVDVMRSLQLEGDVVGDDQLVEDKDYVARIIQACNDYPKIRYWGGIDRSMVSEMFRKAKAYILPCAQNWSEPFGLTVVESMASGCPVIATSSGAIPELIGSAETGIVVKSTQMLSDVVNDINKGKIVFDPLACRKRAEEFSRERMAEGYLKLYQEVLENGGW